MMINHFSTSQTQNALIRAKGFVRSFQQMHVIGIYPFMWRSKAWTLDGALDYHTNLAREKGHKFDRLDKATKRDFTKNKLEKDKDQALAFGMVEDKCIRLREDTYLSRSSISKSIRI